MIVIDANALYRIPSVKNRLWRLLSLIAAGAGHAIATSDITFEEFEANYRVRLRELWKKRRDATLELMEYDAYADVEHYSADDDSLSELLEAGLRDFRESVRVLPSLPEFHLEGLRREIRRRRPASTAWGKPGSGARDVVLWLTAIMECRDSGERMFFVSNDVPAFGKEGLYPELRRELASVLDDRVNDFVYCRNIADLLPLLVDRANGASDIPSLEVLAGDPAVQASVESVSAAYANALAGEMADNLRSTLGAERGGLSMQAYSRSVELRGVNDVSTYLLGGKTWVTATLTWALEVELQRLELPRDPSTIEPGYTGSTLENVIADFSRPVSSRNFDTVTIIQLSREGDDHLNVESVDIISARLADRAQVRGSGL